MKDNDWLNGKPCIATEEDIKAKWGTHEGAFECRICRRKFKIGDIFRFVCCKHKPNFIVCEKCDHEDVEEEFRNRYKEAQAFLEP